MSTLPAIPAAITVFAVAALIAFAAYRRSVKRSVHDLRPELCAELASLGAAIEALPARMDRAKRFRVAAARAMGNTEPEELQQWLRELEIDSSEVEFLRSQLSADDSDTGSLSEMDIEIKLVEVLALSLRAGELAEKYRDSILVQETDVESHEHEGDAQALIREASQYALNDSSPSIIESVA